MTTYASRILLLGCMAWWLWLAGGTLDWKALTFLTLFLSTAWGVGHLTLRTSGMLDVSPSLKTDVPHLAVGAPLLVVGSFLFSLVSPLALWIDGLVIAMVVLALLLCCLWRGHRSRPAATATTPSRADQGVDAVFLILALLITTLWCRDLLGPVRVSGDQVQVRAWGDVYYHLSQITQMASARSLRSLQDIQMAGSHAQPYHLAGYVLPAALRDMTNQSAWVAYCGLLVPFGLLLTALTAFTMLLPVLGRPAAMVAGMALMLLPDAAQMGMGIRFLSYHWLQQVGPAAMYGVSAAAMALMMVFMACKHGRLSWLLWASALVGCVLLLKAQIFVAITYPLLILPALFFKGLSNWKRMGLLAICTLMFLATVQIGQMSPSVPLMRLDGTGLAPYAQMLSDMQSRGALKSWSTHMSPLASGHWWMLAAVFLPVLLLSTFGLHLFTLIWASRASRSSLPPMVIWVPWIITTTYVVMATGLALDDRHVGMPEELIHRPFVWAYFIVVTFAAGTAWHRWYKHGWPQNRTTRLGWIALGLLLLATPIHFGKRIQTMPSWGRGYETLPTCLHQAIVHIQQTTAPSAIILEQQGDPTFAVTALSERTSWAVNSGGYRLPAGLIDRIQVVRQIEKEPSISKALDTLAHAGVDRYIASKTSEVAWLRELAAPSDSVAFQCGDVTVVKVGKS